MPIIKSCSKISDAKRQSFDYELIAMAYHESAHTVIAFFNFMYVFDVNIMTLTRKDGNTSYYTYDFNKELDEDLYHTQLIFELQTLYAGLLGEKMYYKDICGSDAFPMHLRIGSSEDIKMASDLIRKNNIAKSGRQTHLLKKQIQKEVSELLVEHWDAVKIIAHALYKKRKLSFDELKYLLIRRTNHKEFWKERIKNIKVIHNDNNAPPDQEIKDIILEDN